MATAAITTQNCNGLIIPNPSSKRLAIAMQIRAIDTVFLSFNAIFCKNEMFIYYTLN